MAQPDIATVVVPKFRRIRPLNSLERLDQSDQWGAGATMVWTNGSLGSPGCLPRSDDASAPLASDAYVDERRMRITNYLGVPFYN